MGHRIGMAVVCLHISAALYFLVGVLLLLLLSAGEMGAGLAVGIVLLAVCLAMIAGIEFVVYGLHRRKFWAWVAGLCIFGIYLPSGFFPLGALGLWGLLDSGSRKEFGVNEGAGSV